MTGPLTSASGVETLLCLSDTGYELMDFAHRSGLALSCDADATIPHLEKDAKGRPEIILPGRMPAGEATFHAARILRQAQLEQAGLDDTLGRTPAESLWISRLIQAATEATATVTCVEIARAGEDSARRFLEVSGRMDMKEAAEKALDAHTPAEAAAMTAAFSSEPRIVRMDKTFLSTARIRLPYLAAAWASGHERPDPVKILAERLGSQAAVPSLRDPLFMGRSDATEDALSDLRYQADAMSSRTSAPIRKPAP